MDNFTVPDQAQTAVFEPGTGLVCRFAGLPYERTIRAVQVRCTSQGPVFLYYDAITLSGQIAQNSAGASNTWGPVNIRPVPWNSVIIVVWPNAASTDSASAYVSSQGSI